MAGVRFLVAGGLMYAWSRGRVAQPPTWAHWRRTALIGGLLLLGGNGGVVWSLSDNRVPSGLGAVMVATVPLWVVLLDGLRRGGSRPTARVIFGVLLGLIGIAVMVGPAKLAGGGRVDPAGAAALILASLSWAAGSVYTRAIGKDALPSSALLTTAMQMLCGGALLLLVGTVLGNWSRLDLANISMRSVLAVLYLIVFGALIGYTAYIWLLGVVTPARVSTYAYVNPVVAVLLGWLLGGEELTTRTLLAAAVIIAAVVFITTSRRSPAPAPATSEARSEPVVPCPRMDAAT